MQQTKQTKKAKPASEPYLTGSPVDSNTPKGALGVLGGLAACAVGFLLAGAVLTFDSVPLRVALNGALLLLAYSIFYMSGLSAGTGDVNHGEIMYRRQQNGREVTPAERSRCFHPLKGLVTGLLGSLLLFLMALVFALITHRQVATMGTLPSWISGIQGRTDVMAPLAAYTQPARIGLEEILRVIIRICVMPWVNMVGSANTDGLLLMERLSPLLVLLPGLSFGIGYTQGVAARAQVHTDIAQNRKKQARRARREKARREAAQKPQTLN